MEKKWTRSWNCCSPSDVVDQRDIIMLEKLNEDADADDEEEPPPPSDNEEDMRDSDDEDETGR